MEEKRTHTDLKHKAWEMKKSPWNIIRIGKERMLYVVLAS